MKRELSLGLFVLIGLIITCVLIVSIKDIKLKKGYVLNIYFNDTGALPEKSSVRMGGVIVGKVIKLDYYKGKARVKVWIRDGVEIYRNAKATILSRGLLGVKYVAIHPGTPDHELLKNNDEILGTDPIILEEALPKLFSEVKNVSSAISELIHEKKITESLTTIISDAKEITKTIKSAPIKETIENINITSEKLKNISTEIDDFIVKNKKEIEESISKIAGAAKKISDEKITTDITETISSLKKTSQDASNVFKRFSLLKTYWDYNLRYGSAIHNDLGIKIQLRPTKYYQIGLNNISDRPATNGQELTNTLNFLIGGTFDKLTLEGGLLRSKIGFGLNYDITRKISIRTEAFDLLRKNPYFILSTSFNLTRNLKFGLRCEDIFSQARFMGTIGANIEDEDIAYLFNLISLAR